VLVQLVLHVSQGEFRAPYRDIELGKHPGQRANMVLMAMGQDNGPHILPVLDQIGDIGNNDVDAQ